MKVSLFIIVLFLCTYTTWLQKTARNVITEKAAREEVLMERLGCSEKARILAESALADARKNFEKLKHSADYQPSEAPGTVADGFGLHQSEGGSPSHASGM